MPAALSRRKNILPTPHASSIWILSIKRERQRRPAAALPQVSLMKFLYLLEVFGQVLLQRGWHNSDAVFASFSVSDDHLAVAEIKILDAQTKAFSESKTGAVEETSHQPFGAFEVSEN